MQILSESFFEYCVEKYTGHKVEKWYILKIKTYYKKIKKKIKKKLKKKIKKNVVVDSCRTISCKLFFE